MGSWHASQHVKSLFRCARQLRAARDGVTHRPQPRILEPLIFGLGTIRFGAGPAPIRSFTFCLLPS